LAKTRNILSPEHFGSEIPTEIARTVYQFYDEYECAPKNHLFDCLEERLEKKKASDSKIQLYTVFLEKVLEDTEGNKDFILSKVYDFLKQVSYDKTARTIAVQLHKGNLEAAEKIIKEEASKTYTAIQSKSSFDLLGGLKTFFKKKSETDIPGLRTGFELFDYKTKGLRGISVLGAEPKMGKSTFAVNIACAFARQGIKTLYVDFENELYSDILTKVLCISENVLDNELLVDFFKHRNIRGGYKNLENTLKHLWIEQRSSQLNLDRIDLLIDEIRNKDEPIFIVIDSLQKGALHLFHETDRRYNIDKLVTMFEQWKLEKNAIVLTTSELSRAGYDQKGDKYSYKESGDIEYGGDFLLELVHQVDKNKNILRDKPPILRIKSSRKIPKDGLGTVGIYEIQSNWTMKETRFKKALDGVRGRLYR
jgi:replicative DNA helicase